MQDFRVAGTAAVKPGPFAEIDPFRPCERKIELRRATKSARAVKLPTHAALPKNHPDRRGFAGARGRRWDLAGISEVHSGHLIAGGVAGGHPRTATGTGARPAGPIGLASAFNDPLKRLEILESLKRSDPENGMADCLTAYTLLDLGRGGEALANLSQAVGKPLSDYTVLSCQNDEEAYLAAG
jgi:hypothetical protein